MARNRKSDMPRKLKSWGERAAQLIMDSWFLEARRAIGRIDDADVKTAGRLYNERRRLLTEAVGQSGYAQLEDNIRQMIAASRAQSTPVDDPVYQDNQEPPQAELNA